MDFALINQQRSADDEESDLQEQVGGLTQVLLVTMWFAQANIARLRFSQQRWPYPKITSSPIDLDLMTDEWFITFLRFTRAQINCLVRKFDLPRDRLPIRYSIGGFKAVCIMLSRLAFPCRLITLAWFWGRGHSV